MTITRKNTSHQMPLKHDCNGFEYQVRAVNQAINSGQLQCDDMNWQASLDCQAVMDEILKK